MFMTHSACFALVPLLGLLGGCGQAPQESPAGGPGGLPATNVPAGDAVATRPVVGSLTDQAGAVDVVAGGPVRLVWLQDRGDGRDALARDHQLMVMAWDSERDEERAVTANPDGYAKPLLTADARHILYSTRRGPEAFVTRWQGGPPRSLGRGVALTVWRDPATGRDWVYVGLDPTAEDPGEYRRLERFPLDAPELREKVTTTVVVNEDNFQIAPDGRLAGGVFPWPRIGWFDLGRGIVRDAGEGCWAGLSAADASVLWFLDGAHRRMTLIPTLEPDRRWTLTFDAITPLRGHEVYHPRWTSHPRFFVVTGPYTAGKGEAGPAVRAGGTNVEVFLGRLDRSLTRVEAWTPLTRNARADFFPDAWVSPRQPLEAVPGERSPPAAAQGAPRDGRAVVEARLESIAPIPTLRAIAPYRSALLAGRYEITRVIEGQLGETHVAIAHWVLRDGTRLPDADRQPGRTYRVAIEPYDTHPQLEGERLVMAPDASALPLYYEPPAK
jgi:hypothetical protein